MMVSNATLRFGSEQHRDVSNPRLRPRRAEQVQWRWSGRKIQGAKKEVLRARLAAPVNFR